MVEPAAVPRRPAVGVSRRLAEPDQAARDVRRHRHGLRPGQEVQGSRRRGGRTSLFNAESAAQAGRDAREDGALVHAGRGAEDGDGGQRRAARAVRAAQPYPGKLGVVEEGALADLLLVDGDPLANIELVDDPAAELPRHHEGREDLQEAPVEPAVRGPAHVASGLDRLLEAVHRLAGVATHLQPRISSPSPLFTAAATAKVADLVAASGARYLVPFSKHHDGFCLWESQLHRARRRRPAARLRRDPGRWWTPVGRRGSGTASTSRSRSTSTPWFSRTARSPVSALGRGDGSRRELAKGRRPGR